jgi:NADH:ubiquinone oxidoreductase subunit E
VAAPSADKVARAKAKEAFIKAALRQQELEAQAAIERGANEARREARMATLAQAQEVAKRWEKREALFKRGRELETSFDQARHELDQAVSTHYSKVY